MKIKFLDMSSKNEDRSLTSGIPIPQWMRSKTESYGFDPSTLSPPTHEGDFFYMKYPKPQPPTPPPQPQLNLSTVIESKDKAFDQKFIPIMQDVAKSKIIKSSVAEDEECEASVIKVAHQMFRENGKPLRSLTRVETEGHLAPPSSSSSYLKTRRNSKSLPASPMTSPASSPLSKRKTDSTHSSRLQSENGFGESSEYLDKKSGSSWILANFFAAKDSEADQEKKGAVVATSSNQNVVKYKVGSIGKQLAAVNKTAPDASVNPPSSGPPNSSIFKSKPYLRDLNLLTPSSM